jgi:hypothetical protein
MYLYRAIDSVGDTVKFFFSDTVTWGRPNVSCAKRFSVMAAPSASSSTTARPVARQSLPATVKAGYGTARGGSS